MTAIAVIVGLGAYRMGMAQGLALGMAQVEDGRAAVHSYPWHAPGWYGYGWHGPWGFGFGFGFLVPLLFFFVWFAALRMLFWRGPRGPWGRGGWRGPWHRRHHRGRWRGYDRDDDRGYRDHDRHDDRRSYEDDDWHRRGTTL